ncbi:MAG: GNAT family N-acetyltransferase [Propionibacteriaceae bacterium]|nr:GNAT family N-acetyltransferase [Propionibacteriaceae bacterium]
MASTADPIPPVAEAPMAPAPLISELTHADAEAYAHAHLVLLETTYAHLVDPDFAHLRWAERDERIAELHADVDEAADARAAGRTPAQRHLVAMNAYGTIVGVACAAAEVGEWERPFLGDAWVPAAVPTNLAHLYLMPGAHGTGLAQRMLDTALGGAAAYLWVMTDNTRAVAFYRRNGFTVDYGPVNSGQTWGRNPMVRMSRPDQTP